jgi:hypothetical protein
MAFPVPVRRNAPDNKQRPGVTGLVALLRTQQEGFPLPVSINLQIFLPLRMVNLGPLVPAIRSHLWFRQRVIFLFWIN